VTLAFGGRLDSIGRFLCCRRRRENGFCHSGTARTETYDVDAAFMLMKRNAACLIGPLQDALKPDIQFERTGTGVSWRSSLGLGGADGQGELWVGLAWSAGRMERSVAGIGGGTGGRR
jgi:hypothetical protein